MNKIQKGLQIFSLTWKILRKKQKGIFVLLFISILIKALLETIGVSVLIPFVQAILTPEKLIQNEKLKPFLDFFNIESTTSMLIFVSTAIILFYLFKNAYSLLCTYWQQKYRCWVQKDISVSILQEYLKRPYNFFIGTNSSTLLRNIINDADGIMTCINTVFNLLTEAFIVIMLTTFLFITDPLTAGGLVASVLFVLFVPILILGSPIRRRGSLLRTYAASVYKDALQSINGIKEIIVGNKQTYFSKKYEQSYQAKAKNDIVSCVLTAIPSRLIETICIASLIGIVAFKVISGDTSDVMVSQLSAFAVAAFKLLPSVSGISNNFNTLVLSYPVLTSVYENLNEKVEHLEVSKNPKQIEFNSEIKIKNVSFSYNETKSIFENVNISICKGDVVGIVGPSGAGKTTFVDVLLGLLHNTTGEIYIDDQLLNKDTIASWREKISYVPQTAYLIDDTIESNIAFGLNEDAIDKDRIASCLKDSMLCDYVDSLPAKEKTVVGERGIQMSGGQRQRLSIARALYSNPDIIVFDEATSALDEGTEKEIMESINNLIGSKTLIIIAHRLSTLQKCNKIFEVNNNTVVLKDRI